MFPYTKDAWKAGVSSLIDTENGAPGHFPRIFCTLISAGCPVLDGFQGWVLGLISYAQWI